MLVVIRDNLFDYAIFFCLGHKIHYKYYLKSNEANLDISIFNPLLRWMRSIISVSAEKPVVAFQYNIPVIVFNKHNKSNGPFNYKYPIFSPKYAW